MIEKITTLLKDSKHNVFDIALYSNGCAEYDTVNKAGACQNSYSVSKSVISLATGIAQQEGYLSIYDPIVKYFDLDLPCEYDEKLNSVAVRDLLTMSMGHAEGYLFEADRYSHAEKDWLKLCLSKPLEYAPGEKFVYSNSCYYLLSCLLRRAIGQDVLSYISAKLFAPLNIECYTWERCPKDEIMGATGLFISTADLLKIGIMCLNGGKAPNGKVIVDESYLTEATKIQAPDAGYGYGFWIGDGCYKAVGRHSQTISVYPDRGVVFAAHAFEDDIKYGKFIREIFK